MNTHTFLFGDLGFNEVISMFELSRCLFTLPSDRVLPKSIYSFLVLRQGSNLQVIQRHLRLENDKYIIPASLPTIMFWKRIFIYKHLDKNCLHLLDLLIQVIALTRKAIPIDKQTWFITVSDHFVDWKGSISDIFCVSIWHV